MGSRGAEKKKASNGPAWSIYAGEIHLINVDNLSNCFLLPDDALAQVRLKLQGFAPCPGGIQWNICQTHFLALSLLAYFTSGLLFNRVR